MNLIRHLWEYRIPLIALIKITKIQERQIEVLQGKCDLQEALIDALERKLKEAKQK